MKRIMILLASGLLLLSAFTACQKEEDPPASSSEEEVEASEAEAPDPATPEGAMTGLLRSAKEWDTPSIDAYLPDGSTIGSHVPAAFNGAVSSLLRRMEYRVGESSISGDTATVEVELTTVNAEGALGDAIVKIVTQVAKQQLTGQPIDDYTAVIDEAIRSIDIDALPTATTNATAHMILGADGEWKLDASNESNLPLLNAATGGAVDMAQKLRSMAESYGISLDNLSYGG